MHTLFANLLTQVNLTVLHHACSYLLAHVDMCECVNAVNEMPAQIRLFADCIWLMARALRLLVQTMWWQTAIPWICGFYSACHQMIMSEHIVFPGGPVGDVVQETSLCTEYCRGLKDYERG